MLFLLLLSDFLFNSDINNLTWKMSSLSRSRRLLTGFARWSKWQAGRQRGRRWSWEACKLQGHFAHLQNNSTTVRGIEGHAEMWWWIHLSGHTYIAQCEKRQMSMLHNTQLVHIWLCICHSFVFSSRGIIYYLTAVEVGGLFQPLL